MRDLANIALGVLLALGFAGIVWAIKQCGQKKHTERHHCPAQDARDGSLPEQGDGGQT